MALPNVDQAIVEERKITDYLLDVAHPENRGKAGFFHGHGFTADRWDVLADALRDHARAAQSVERVQSSHGTKYIADGPIQTPSGRSPHVRSIWIIDTGEQIPRLVTAYPQP